MESELPKIVQEKISYYREILSKLNSIIKECSRINFRSTKEESQFLKKKIIENFEDINLLKTIREMKFKLLVLTRNPYNYQPYEKINYSYNIINDNIDKKEVKVFEIIEKLWSNDGKMPIDLQVVKMLATGFVSVLNEATELALSENKANKYYSTFNSLHLLKSIFLIQISNFQAIQKILTPIPIDAQFIAFTGENGDGKTSILQAIGLGLYNSDDMSDEDRGNENSYISMRYQEKNKPYTNDILNNPRKPTEYATRHHMKELKSFAAYGTSRLRVSDKKEMQNPLLNLDPERAKLTNIFDSWLRDVSVNDKELFEKVKSIILKILPNVSEIKKKDETKIISDFLFIEKGIEVEFKHLSAGHKSIVLMIGDMIMRLSEAQPKEKNPSDFTGIVLIDEIEAHLHPKWQKEFPHILSTTFPKVQFIVTTHSAISLLGMPENTVFFRVQRSEEKGTYIERMDIDVKNLLPNAIYTSPLFDMESIRSTENKGIEELNVEDNFDEIIKKEENKKRLKELSKKFVFTPPKS